MEFISYIDLHLVYLLFFSIALSFGAGSALLSGVLTLSSVRDGSINETEYSVIRYSHVVGIVAFIMYAFSGLGLFTISYEKMITLGIFWASQTIVLILAINIAFFWFYFLPHLRTCVGLSCTISKHISPTRLSGLLVSELLVMISWIFLIVHHVLYTVPMNFFLFLAFYTFMLTCFVLWYLILSRSGEEQAHELFLKKVTAVSFIITVSLALLGLRGVGNIAPYSEPELEKRESLGTPEKEVHDKKNDMPFYQMEEVALHNNTEDCWVIMYGEVFDASDAVSMFPEIYTCGADVTAKYRTVVPEGISDRMRGRQVGAIGYTREEVSQHNTKKDCWLIIDTSVFNATEESSLHPAAFHCGADTSENYHKNHGEGISDKMMQYRIGIVDAGTTETKVSEENTSEEIQLTPTRELYVREGSWDPHNLMVIVEKDPEKILFVDGITHTPVGRIHNIGFQPHTSVYTEDAHYMFIIARDGWLTKINLKTLEPVKSVKVGINSRGTALTDDGKYLVIGNYEPGNAVVVDPVSLDILKTIPTVGTVGGKDVESRVGAVIEDGDTVILALKDLNSVWVIDTSKSDFPVTHKYDNIGNNQTPLHDAFLTPDGKYYIVASMGSNTVWVLNTDTWEPVAEVPTGKTPHTGPGATWGNNIFVPALGEGLITVIDTTTWKAVAHIPTGGPGLFVRSFLEDPTYPYVWAETAFGEHQDEIYVIDARTNTITKTLKPVEGESSWHPEFTNDGKFVYVVSQSGNKVVVYDAHSFAVIKTIDSDTPSAVSNVGNRIEEHGL